MIWDARRDAPVRLKKDPNGRKIVLRYAIAKCALLLVANGNAVSKTARESREYALGKSRVPASAPSASTRASMKTSVKKGAEGMSRGVKKAGKIVLGIEIER